MLKAEFCASPTSVVLSKRDAVPSDLWLQLPRNLSPSGATTKNGRLYVPITDFLAARHWLADALQRYECDIDLSEPIQAILGRESLERDEVRGLLAAPFFEASADPILVGARFVQNRNQDLKEFQRRDLRRMLSMSNSANFSVPGAGKTAVTYACYEIQRQSDRVERLLVVSPLSAFDSWCYEAEKWFSPAPRVGWFDGAIPRNCEVLLVNYQRLANNFALISDWIGQGPCHVVLDEAHRIKEGVNGEWGRACLDLAHLAARRDILTGTPAPQRPRDFVALLDFLWPRQSMRILPLAATSTLPTNDTMREVSRRLRPLFARTTKNELRLRAPKLRVEYVSMKPLQQEIYDVVRGQVRNLAYRDRRQFLQIAEVRMYLLQAATNPALLAPALGASRSLTTWPPSPVPTGSSLVEKTIRYSSYEIPRKFEKLASMIAANAKRGRKTLVWSNFVGNLRDLSNTILAPYSPALIYGEVPSSKRERQYATRETELRRFRTDDRCQVLLANPQAMSEGVSLHQECHDAVYLDRTFNAGQYLQSLDRIHRLGLEPGIETRITFLVSRNTIDEVVDVRVRRKAERLSLMLADPHLLVMALPDYDDYGEEVDAEDIDELLNHLAARGIE